MGAQKLEFYKTVRAAFLDIAAKNPERFVVVDSSGTMEDTSQKVLNAARERLHV
jgi:dTMP kinase